MNMLQVSDLCSHCNIAFSSGRYCCNRKMISFTSTSPAYFLSFAFILLLLEVGLLKVITFSDKQPIYSCIFITLIFAARKGLSLDKTFDLTCKPAG